jgi:hypothetical protein
MTVEQAADARYPFRGWEGGYSPFLYVFVPWREIFFPEHFKEMREDAREHRRA